MPFKLTRSLVRGSTRHAEIIVTETFVSNGVWAARKEAFDAPATLRDAETACEVLKLDGVREVAEEKIAAMFRPHSDARRFMRTGLVHTETGGRQSARLFTTATGEETWIDEKYVQAFNLWDLNGPAGGPLRDAEGYDATVIVMPRRIDLDDVALTWARRVVADADGRGKWERKLEGGAE